ncbi:hypothetical protein [Acidithiobacillus sp.]|uniref:hypothetical protein n=1 Tax=Acidithiobacillus sp. TaxID=1872118 RepID=UPI003CFDA05D
MQILMLFLEVLVVVLVLAEGFMRLRSYLSLNNLTTLGQLNANQGLQHAGTIIKS